MSDFLASLVERSLAPRPAVQPRLISLFEPLSADGPAIFPHDDQPQPPAIEKQSEAIPDRVSQLESLWRTSPERTVAAETVQTPRVVRADQLGPDILEAQPSILARSDEVDVIGIRADSPANQDQAARPSVAPPAAPNEKSTKPVAREPEKNQPTGLIANTDTDRAKPDRRERHAPRTIFAARELAVIAFPKKSKTDQSRNTGRQELQDAPNVTSIPSVAPQPRQKRSNDAVVKIEPELTETTAPDRRAPGKIFPAREIQPVQPKPAPITRISSRQPPHLPESERSIHVMIGRVEVRATLPAPLRSQPPRASAPIMSLDEYLRERAGGSRR